MRDISTKINDSAPASTGYLDATEFNSTQTELENAVLATPGGVSLDASMGPDSSLYMLAQSITRHSAGGAIYCTATGSASAHVVSMADANVRPPTTLFKGLTCRYDPPAPNATSAVTVNAFGLGVKALVNHVSAPLSSTEIDGRVIDIYYDPSIGSGSWVLPAWSNALYVGQTPSSPPGVSSGEGVEIDGSNLANLNFPGLAGDPTPASTDQFAFYDVADTAHKAITYAQLAAALSSGSAGGGLLNIQLVTASGTYTKTAGTTKALVFAVGGGGGGGGNAGTNPGSGAGGGGGTAIALADLSAVSTVACTIGAGGAGGVGGVSGSSGGSTSFGSYATATGGAGGAYYPNGEAEGGEGGIGTVGLVKIGGNAGGTGHSLGGGVGGSSFFGGGGGGGNNPTPPSAGHDGRSYGGGGGGGDAVSGGTGASGCILVIEFS